MTWTQLNPERDIRLGDVSSPLRNCYDNLLAEASKSLKSTEEGERWLEALQPHGFDGAAPRGPSRWWQHSSPGRQVCAKVLEATQPGPADLPGDRRHGPPDPGAGGDGP